MDRIGPMYDIIKKSLIPTPAPVIKEKIVREKPAKEDNTVKKEKPAKAVKDPVTKLTATQQPANAGSKSNKLAGLRILPTGRLFSRFTSKISTISLSLNNLPWSPT